MVHLSLPGLSCKRCTELLAENVQCLQHSLHCARSFILQYLCATLWWCFVFSLVRHPHKVRRKHATGAQRSYTFQCWSRVCSASCPKATYSAFHAGRPSVWLHMCPHHRTLNAHFIFCYGMVDTVTTFHYHHLFFHKFWHHGLHRVTQNTYWSIYIFFYTRAQISVLKARFEQDSKEFTTIWQTFEQPVSVLLT